MVRSINEVRNFLNSMVGKSPQDKSNSGYNGQCVALVKNLLEYLGVPDPYQARGQAKDYGDTVLRQGIAKSGKGTLNLHINRLDGGGFGHIWITIAGELWQSNKGYNLTTTKNDWVPAIHQTINLDRWLTGGTTPPPPTSTKPNDVFRRHGNKFTLQKSIKVDAVKLHNGIWQFINFDLAGVRKLTNKDWTENGLPLAIAYRVDGGNNNNVRPGAVVKLQRAYSYGTIDRYQDVGRQYVGIIFGSYGMIWFNSDALLNRF